MLDFTAGDKSSELFRSNSGGVRVPLRSHFNFCVKIFENFK